MGVAPRAHKGKGYAQIKKLFPCPIGHSSRNKTFFLCPCSCYPHASPAGQGCMQQPITKQVRQKMKKDIYQEVTNRVIEALEKISLEDYQAPFARLTAQQFPINPMTKNKYNGINYIALMVSAARAWL